MRPSRDIVLVATAVATLTLAVGLAERVRQATGVGAQLSVVLVIVISVAAGGPVATAVLRLADRGHRPGTPGPADPDVLHGGAWIGALERLAVTASLLAGSPEGVAIALAVKSLGRYPELRAPAAAERFIIGTFASVLWASGCAWLGTAVLS